MPSPPPKPRPRSYEDVSSITAQEAAETRARAAVRLAEAAENLNEELQLQLEVEQRVAEELRLQLRGAIDKLPAPAQVPSEYAVSVKGKKLRIAVPITLLLSAAPFVWAVVADYLEMKRQFKEQAAFFVKYEQRFDALDRQVKEQVTAHASLRETVAQLSGYLAGVLPKAGLKVPSEPGATQVTVVSDPLPAGAKRPIQVNVRTPVPAPSPKPARGGLP